VDIHAVLPVLAALLQSADAEVLSHACWALSHLCDGPSAHISAVVGADVCWRLVQLLTHRSWRVTKPALRTIGNIVCAEDETDYTQHILEAGAVPCLRQVIMYFLACLFVDYFVRILVVFVVFDILVSFCVLTRLII